jgi:hypothetical protein
MEALLVVSTLLFAALFFYVFLCFRVLTEIHCSLSKIAAASSHVTQSLEFMDASFFRHHPFHAMQAFFQHVEGYVSDLNSEKALADKEI